ncbi:MAG: pyridoxal phosphate-dependent aminotransferase family protein [Campylobacterales bacterium]|nr:pyridoxal phosphate-dependent aminotransferase family protein [Campylobacterales bacterium]
MYDNELIALKKSNRFRERILLDSELIDLGTNDYLGLASNGKQVKKAIKLLLAQESYAPKASMLVGGYHMMHALFENELAVLNGFESAIMLSSGFLANIALIESLVRKGDFLLMDEEFHASGILAAKLIEGRYEFFKHNDPNDLREKLQNIKAKRVFVAIEGVYSMSGDICKKEIFDLADEFGVLMIVDEAHSSGVLGKNLLGVFDYFDIAPKENHIKMGTLGKAYGSQGAYILASKEIISFLENRAKPIIYSTAPSLFDAALALVNLRYISKAKHKLTQKIQRREKLAREVFGKKFQSLIIPIEQKDNQSVQKMQKILREKGYFVGAIRQPTVAHPIIRVIPRTNIPLPQIKEVFEIIREIDDRVQ